MVWQGDERCVHVDELEFLISGFRLGDAKARVHEWVEQCPLGNICGNFQVFVELLGLIVK